jgi:glycine cleavage system H lipoate-binding protein
MEGFHYVDIFATKGIEYIIVLGFLFILIYFWGRLNRQQTAAAAAGGGKQTAISLVDWFHLADNYHYHQGHTWAAPAEQNSLRVGVDDFVQKLIGKVDKIRLPEKGSVLRQGETGFTFEVDGRTIPVLAPVDGEVTRINTELLKDTEKMQQDPYGSGWLFEVRPKDLKRNMSQLFTGNMAKAWLQHQVDRISELMTARMGVVLQDGGAIAPGFARELEPENWDDLTREFLLTK